ncbi:MAG: hypothetical protein EBW88_00115 [Betaproteobacteria bacterium]|nr:hypothetical protein [Betaproteobacteria bacterium]
MSSACRFCSEGSSAVLFFASASVTFYTEVVRVGNTSITVRVEVFAERVRQRGEIIKVTEATLSFVAIGSDKRPRPVPPEGE